MKSMKPMKSMKFTLYPSTKTGVFSISFMIMAVILVVVVAYLAEDIKIADDGAFFDHMNLAIMTLVAFSFAVIAFVSGVLAIMRDGENSILCYGAILISALAVILGVAEFIGEMNALNPQTK